MALKFVKIDAEVQDVLNRSFIKDTHLRLPPGQLERGLYDRVNKVLVAAGGKWNKKEKAHVFDKDPSEVLGLAAVNGQIENKKTSMQQFFTPPDLADRLVEMADIHNGMMVLEPSAGTGRIADAIARCFTLEGEPGPECIRLTLLEIDRNLVDRLRQKPQGYDVICTDYPRTSADGGWDRIVMNPPFANDQDIVHVLHAFKHLKPGGRLVAIMSPGFTYGESKVRKSFMGFVNSYGTWEKLPEGSFQESGTNVNTVVVTLDKPLAGAGVEAA